MKFQIKTIAVFKSQKNLPEIIGDHIIKKLEKFTKTNWKN